ncbi:phage tail protein [Lysobacter humi (ex Lee et al. 2017)]
MTDQFLAEIRVFGFNFNPTGWAFCNGATMPISQNTALFALLGTMYGGDGKSTFQLPNLASRAACGAGQGAGLAPRVIGEAFGVEAVTLVASEIPAHTHSLTAYSQTAAGTGSYTPVNGGGLSLLASNAAARTYAATPNTTMGAAAVGGGSDLPHNNMQPYLAMNFCIALQGVFPPRT